MLLVLLDNIIDYCNLGLVQSSNRLKNAKIHHNNAITQSMYNKEAILKLS
jgi:hypothetical protein